MKTDDMQDERGLLEEDELVEAQQEVLSDELTTMMRDSRKRGYRAPALTVALARHLMTSLVASRATKRYAMAWLEEAYDQVRENMVKAGVFEERN